MATVKELVQCLLRYKSDKTGELTSLGTFSVLGLTKKQGLALTASDFSM